MADNAEKDKKDNSFMMKLATLIVDKRKGFYLIFIVLCIFAGHNRDQKGTGSDGFGIYHVWLRPDPDL